MATKRANPKHHPPPAQAARGIAKSDAQPPRPVLPTARAVRPTITRAASWPGSALFVLAVALVLGWRVEPWLRYQDAPAFFVDADFWMAYVREPGRPLTGLAAALAQSSYHNWLATTAWMLVFGAIHACARRLFGSVAGLWPAGAAGMLTLLVAALPGRFAGDAEGTALGLLAALAGANAWLVVSARSRTAGLACAWGIAVAVFYVAGTLPLGLFLSSIALIQWLARKRLPLCLGCSLGLLAVPVWAMLHPGFHAFAMANHWGAGFTRLLHAAAFAFAPVWMAVGAGLAWVEGRVAIKDSTTETRERGRGDGRGVQGIGLGRASLGKVLAGGVGCALLWISLDTDRQARARLETLAPRRDWGAVLVSAGAVRTWTASARLQVMRALYHAGRLSSDLFTTYQRRGWDLLPNYDAGLEMSRAEAQTLLELGQVNLAEHLAHEALELQGAQPETLRLLANINILKERPQAARVFLTRLGLAPFHAREARRALQTLATDPRGTNQAELEMIRTRLPRTDEPEARLPTETVLLQLLEANPKNPMALEYLIAHRLLNLQLEDLARDLNRFDIPTNAPLPRPIEEALLLLRDNTPAPAVELWSRPASLATVERYRRFVELSGRHQGRPAAARAALAPGFGETFWFYARFGESAPQPTRVTRARSL
jgi:hypothetical protein